MPPRPGHRLRTTLGLVALAGCTPDPSYTVSWRLVDEPGMDASEGVEPDKAVTCATVGLSQVRLTTLSAGAGDAGQCVDVIVDERSYACFAGLPVDGPVLEQGSYTVLVQGLRRSGEPWTCETDELDLTCDDTPSTESCYARAMFEIEVGADGKISGDELILAALAKPLPCDDGIDNDADGRVDSNDPGCFDRVADGELVPLLDRSEDDDDGLTVLQTTVSLLGTPVVQSRNLGIDSYEIGYRTSPNEPVTALEQVNQEDLDYTKYPFALPLVDDSGDPFDLDIADQYQILMTALDDSGAPLTNAILPEGEQDSVGDGYFIGEWLFRSSDFLAPLEYPLRFLHEPLLGVRTQSTPNCQLNGTVGTLDELWVRVRDIDNDVPLDAATLGLEAPNGALFAAVDEADGWISLACPPADMESQTFNWGSYQIEAQARSGGAVCFETDGPVDLAPQATSDAQVIPLVRLFNDDDTAVCPECMDDDDCGQDMLCNTGTSLCIEKEPGSG